mgnify:CR=1 FL=1
MPESCKRTKIVSTLIWFTLFFTKHWNVKTLHIVLITCFSALSITSVFAQKPKKNFKTGGIVQLNDSLTTFSQSDIFNFPNVNKIKRYYDANALKKIKQLEQQLLDSQLKEEAYRRMIDIAEKELKVSIRKKPNTK